LDEDDWISIITDAQTISNYRPTNKIVLNYVLQLTSSVCEL